MNNITREQIIASRPIVEELERRGVKLFGNGNERSAKCMFHEDRTPSFFVNVQKQTWICRAGCGGGSVIDLIAMFENQNAKQVYKDLANEQNGTMNTTSSFETASAVKPVTERIYIYEDHAGNEVFQVHRFRPKTFRQCHRDASGALVWNMEGVTRVLYRLPQILAADEITVVEGERDVETLVELGFQATCNVGGAGKWLDTYTESLADKNVVVCGDNDRPGREHSTKIMESLAGKVKTLRRIKLHGDFKDITEYLETFEGTEAKTKAFVGLRDAAQILHRGIDLPMRTLAEIEPDYIRFVEESKKSPIDLGRWLPGLRGFCRPLIPGDFVTVIAATAVGKTAILQNIAASMLDIPTVLFEMELSEEAMFERFVGQKGNLTGDQVEESYHKGGRMGTAGLEAMFGNLMICTISKMDIPTMETLCKRAELKLGCPPKLILVDYVQLVVGEGNSRYERFSDIAEGLRRLARTLRCVLVATSQIKRTDSEDPKVNLSSAKESGSIENSSSLVLGAWRTASKQGGLADKMVIKVLKNSRGSSGREIECDWATTFRITQKQHAF